MHKIVLCCVSLITAASCIKLPSSSSQYDITWLRRKDLHSQPCVTGHIDQPFARDGRVQYTIIASDKLATYPDTSGHYCRVFLPGTHIIIFAFIGLSIVKVKPLDLHLGDSVRLDVHMRQDSVALR